MKTANSDQSSAKYKRCPKCHHYTNPHDAKSCEICNTSLLSAHPVSLDKNKRVNRGRKAIIPINRFPPEIVNKFVSQNNRVFFKSTLRDLRKPINLIGLTIVAFGIALWLKSIRPNLIIPNNVSNSQRNNQVAQVNVPQGIFNYGGAGVYASVVASGIHGEIENKYKGYELRYTKPFQDFSSYKAIRMLLDGELSFAYNDRPLTDEEYEIAKLRNIKLRQISIALDGVVVYSNQSIKVNELSIEQLLKIFSGEITNWNEVDSDIENLPIVPVFVKNEYISLLGTNSNSKVAESIEYKANYTQAIRKVIGTPGAISFASAAITGNQQLIKRFNLSDGGSSNYISPMIEGNINFEDFKSGRYPWTRRVFLVWREDRTLDQRGAEIYADYLTSKNGQRRVEQAGLIPIINHKSI